MDRDTARLVLGVGRDTAWLDVRDRYRALVRRHHPDVAAHPGASATTARLTAAYRVLRDAHAHGLQPEPPTPGAPTAPVVIETDGEVLLLDAPHEEAFFALLEAAHALGEVAYLDADAGLLETIVELGGHAAASVLVTLQGRAHGTEAFVTVEPLGATPAPTAASVVAVLGALLATVPPAAP